MRLNLSVRLAVPGIRQKNELGSESTLVLCDAPMNVQYSDNVGNLCMKLRILVQTADEVISNVWIRKEPF